MVGLFVMPSSTIFRQHTRLNAATNKTTKKSPTRGDLQRIETILQHHLTNFQKSVFKRRYNKNINALRIVMLYGLSSNLASYVPSYVSHESTNLLPSMLHGNQDLLSTKHGRYRDVLHQLDQNNHHQ